MFLFAQKSPLCQRGEGMRDSYVFYKDKLETEYRNVFGQIEMYVMSRYADEEILEERMGELLDNFLNAQQSGRAPESVTGHDLERFCENFCGDFGSRITFLYMADWLCGMAWFFLIEALADVIFYFADSGEKVFPAILYMPKTENMMGYMIGLMVSVIAAAAAKAFTRQVMFRKKRVSLKWLKMLICGAALFSFIAVFLLVSTEWPAELSCPQIVIFIVSGIYLLFYYRFRKKKKTEKVRFSDLLVEELEKTMPEDMEKKFQKQNRKRRKHGKSEITFEEFLEEEEKNCRLQDKLCNLEMLLIPAIGLIVGFVCTYLDGGFEGISDMIWFTVIVLALESVIMFGMRRVTRASVTARKKWILFYRERKNVAEEK